MLDDCAILVTARVGRLCHFGHFVLDDCVILIPCVLFVLVTTWIANPSIEVVVKGQPHVTSSPSLSQNRRVLSYGSTHKQYVLGDTFPTCCISICLHMLNPRCKSLSFGTSSVE